MSGDSHPSVPEAIDPLIELLQRLFESVPRPFMTLVLSNNRQFALELDMPVRWVGDGSILEVKQPQEKLSHFIMLRHVTMLNVEG